MTIADCPNLKFAKISVFRFLFNTMFGYGIISTLSSRTATFIADGEASAGNLVVEIGSTFATIVQSKATLTGGIQNCSLTIDTTCMRTLTADSYPTSISDAGGISGATVSDSSN